MDPERKKEKVPRNDLKDEWLPPLAREYGIVFCKKADSKEAMDVARSLLGKAAQNGDEKAREILLKMSVKDRGDTGFVRPAISENQADARADAVRQKRAAAFFPVYFVDEKVKVLYPDSRAKRNIESVQIRNGRNKSVAGEKLWELSFRVRRPDVRVAADFKGGVFICVEFTDRKSGEKYFHIEPETTGKNPYNSYTSKGTDRSMGSVYLDMNPYPDARLTGWAVVYGHSPKDETVLAVFDSESKDRRTFVELCRDNANSKQLEAVVTSIGDEAGADNSGDAETGGETVSEE